MIWYWSFEANSGCLFHFLTLEVLDVVNHSKNFSQLHSMSLILQVYSSAP